MALKSNDKDIRDDQNLTGLSMPFYNSNIFFTQTFSNVKRKQCSECMEQWLTGHPDYHSHLPSYTYVLKCLHDISSYFDGELSQFVVEGTPNFLKKIESYADEHKMRGLFTYKDNTRVTRPHIHGFVKYVNIKHFKQILHKSKLFRDEYNNPCSCFSREIITKNGNSQWVYKNQHYITGNEIEDVRPRECLNHIIPKIIKVPVGFHDYQPIRNDYSVEKYITKYLQKDGCEGRIG